MPVGRRACSLYYACVAASLLFCITPVGQQACSSVLRLCGGVEKKKEKKREKKFCCLCGCKLKACSLYYACGAAKKKKREEEFFVACLAVSLKLVVLYYACGAAGL